MVRSRIASKHDSTVVDAVAVEQLAQPARAHQAGRALGVEVGGQRLGHPRVAGHDRQRRPVGDACVPQLDRRDHQALLEDAGRVVGIEPGTAPPMSSWWPKACTNATTLAASAREDRNRHAQVGQVPDAALGAVDVVVEEDVALAHLVDREVARHRVHQRRVGAAGELAQQPVVDAGAEVVGVADHRAAGGAGDGGLDLHLHAGQRSLDDLDQHRVGARARSSVSMPNGNWVGARRLMPVAPRHDDVEVVVHAGREARVQRHRRAELLDDRRAVDRRAGARSVARRSACRRSRPASKQTGRVLRWLSRGRAQRAPRNHRRAGSPAA